MPAFIEVRKYFLNKEKHIQEKPKKIYQISKDTKSIYTNIPNSKRFAETKKAFDILIFEVVNTFLAFMETLNNFAFNCIESLALAMRKSTICTLF